MRKENPFTPGFGEAPLIFAGRGKVGFDIPLMREYIQGQHSE